MYLYVDLDKKSYCNLREIHVHVVHTMLNKCKFTPKEMAAELPTLLVLTYTHFPTKHLKGQYYLSDIKMFKYFYLLLLY